MFVIVSIGNGCSIRFCRCDHISITVITVSNRCSVISSCTGQLILLIISIRGCLSILSCLRCYIAKCIISVSFCSGCCRFGSKLIFCIISLFTGCSIRIFNGCCAVLIIIMINGLISFVIRCCSRTLSVLESCRSFFCISLLYNSSFFIVSILYNRIAILIFPACHTAVIIIFVLFCCSIRICYRYQISLLIIFVRNFSTIWKRQFLDMPEFILFYPECFSGWCGNLAQIIIIVIIQYCLKSIHIRYIT